LDRGTLAVGHAGMLGGQIVFNRLSAEDAKAIQIFYAMLKLDPAEVERRKAPRTLMNKSESWEFAETSLRNALEESL